ncbi:hypothetical protein [Dechloromonas sp.]|uniref:DUF7931 domain-containing protein n=1 Tax=Dechloromonas sp. TaxID=1917218 RepID=UPI00120EBBBE|nr:hypothetical protein [Dechloromonas sp.]MBU3696039.1 hypothetical protein [Dechloromonas sp.]TEX47047.1 MAG: hypothetical protein CFR70_10570 [Rhodocyclaceae bacterium]
MTRELITTWADYQLALDRLLALATRQVMIYDEDLKQLSLDGTRLVHFQRVLAAGEEGALRIALRDSAHLNSHSPRLLSLLATWSHRAAAQQTPEHMSQLRDSMILVDGRHGLIRFDRDQPRSKLLIDAPESIRAYCQRFDALWNEGGEPVSTFMLGL